MANESVDEVARVSLVASFFEDTLAREAIV